MGALPYDNFWSLPYGARRVEGFEPLDPLLEVAILGVGGDGGEDGRLGREKAHHAAGDSTRRQGILAY